MKTIGIKLADGSFYPVLQEGSSDEVVLDLTTAHNNQTKIMVDLYRSKTNSMDDAEYVDSLQIENLNEHPNGEPDISFTVSLDENNELHAKIVDPETGATSNSTITLVSRTLEERLVTDEYDISTLNEPSVQTETDEQAEETAEQTEAAAVAAMATGVGLLAAAEAIRAENNADNTDEDFDIVDNDFTLGDPTFEETAVTIDPEPTSEPEVEPAPEPTEDFFAMPETQIETETEPSPTNADDTIQFSETAVSSQFVEDPLSEFGGEAEVQSKKDSLTDFFGNVSSDETPAESEEPAEPEQSTDTTDFTDTEMPDFSFDSIPEETETPDFSIDESIPDDNTFAEDNPLNSDNTFTEDNPLENFDLDIPEPDFSQTESSSLNDDLFADNMPASGGGISFTGLYDKETELGESDDSSKKKTRTPVIICIICAIICIIAVALILFVLPTKYNLLNKKTECQKDVPVEQPVSVEEPVVEPEPEPIPEPVPQAKEDEIIVIEKAEEVIPLPPPVAEEKPKDITYKIKWGDTLWDIADTYYKNPWRYKYIARFNGIKNPDYIISGTYITIPAE